MSHVTCECHREVNTCFQALGAKSAVTTCRRAVHWAILEVRKNSQKSALELRHIVNLAVSSLLRMSTRKTCQRVVQLGQVEILKAEGNSQKSDHRKLC